MNWPIVYDVGPKSNQHWIHVLCVMGTQNHLFGAQYRIGRRSGFDLLYTDNYIIIRI